MLLVGDATVSWYVHHYEIAARLDLSEDYGFGLLTFLIDCAVAVVTLPFTLFAGWRLSRRIQRALVANRAAGSI